MNFRVMRVSLSIMFCLCWPSLSNANEFPTIEAKVNDQTVRLLLDSGASHPMLLTSAAERINLNWTTPPTKAKHDLGEVVVGISDECRLSIGSQTIPLQFLVLDAPEEIFKDIDGVLGWPNITNSVLHIDSDEKSIIKKEGQTTFY